MANETNTLGKSVSRVDGRLKVTGAARYAADQTGRNIAHAWLIKSRIGRGRITAFDTAEAEKLPGVLGLWSHKKAPRLFLTGDNFMDGNILGEKALPLQNDQILYHGQTIGFVVAESLEIARQAAGLVRVRYEEKPPVVAWEKPGVKTVEPAQVDFQPAKLTRTAESGADFAALLDGAEVKVEATYLTPLQHHVAMEPHATVAEWDDDRLTLHNCSQWMTGQQRTMAEVLGIPSECVRVVCPFLGGGFGCKATIWWPAALAAFAARELKRAVKIVTTREQTFNTNGHRPGTLQTLQLGASKDGRIQALRHTVLSTSSEITEFVEPAAHRTSVNFYSVPNVEVAHKLAVLNVGAPTWMRAPGETPGMFALESAMDELALALGTDPLELRLRNYAEQDLQKKVPFSFKHLRECYEKGAAAIGWSERSPEPRQKRDGDWLIGLGMASACYPGYRMPSSARVRLLADGTAVVGSATHDLGTGMYTIMTQVAAEALGLPLDKVRAELGDSSLPPATVAGGSMSTASVMPAVQAAAASLKRKLAALATRDPKSPLKGAKADEVQFADGQISAGERREPMQAVIGRAGLAALEATESSAPGDEGKKYSFYSYGAHFVEVKVHALTGEIRVSRIVSAMDIGRVLNAKTARSQVIGGVIGGLGMALMEESLLDPKTARIVTADLGAYHVPVNADVPPIEVFFTDKPDLNFNPLGARGVGEIGITGVAAAVANAVWHATGVRVRDLPITPEKIFEQAPARAAV
ncbi:MAG: xanthine dehydrogenase family protein molybdopterin-binding subunit [Verrucomicrobia bacterium]|nr:xanthine dehydrogenase family protein molybdopterin-binding subunit [Verrucomicrobiota bacterium]